MNYPLPPDSHAELISSLAEKMKQHPLQALRNLSGEGIHSSLETASRWLGISRDRISFGSGGHHILASIVQGFSNPGDSIACEEITYNGWLEICQNHGRRSLGIKSDKEGMLPDELEKAVKENSIRGIFLMPTLHNPLSTFMPLHRRRDIVEVCRKHGLWVIDDDAYRFLHPSPIESFAHLYPENTFWIQSFTKSLFPSLKTAVVVSPAKLTEKLALSLRYAPSGLTLPWIMDLLDSKEYQNIIEAKQNEALERQQMARQILGNHPVKTVPTSFHLWMDVPDAWECPGVSVMPASRYYAGTGKAPSAIRITLAGEPEREKVLKGLELISQKLRPL